MLAVRIHHYGGVEELVIEDVVIPQPVDDQVLVRVYAASVNPVDWKIRTGYGKEFFGHTLPITLGCDLAGVVESVGNGVTRFKPGDAVLGYVSLRRLGAYAEWAIATEAELALKPQSIDFIHAASLPVVVLTAWQALFDQAHLSAGQTVLIHAAAGGVGSMGVQLAKQKGAYVIGTASARNTEFLHELGVDQIIDYQTTQFEDVLKDIDVVLDTMGGETQTRSLSIVKTGGHLVSIVNAPPPQEAIQASMMSVQPNGTQLSEIAAMVDAGQLKPIVETVLPLSEIKQAHTLSESGRTRGKIVLQVSTT